MANKDAEAISDTVKTNHTQRSTIDFEVINNNLDTTFEDFDTCRLKN
jgi:hypothetical protein